VQEYIQNILILTSIMNMSLTYYIAFLICPLHYDYKVTGSIKKKGIIPISALRSAIEKNSHRFEKADHAGLSYIILSSFVKYSLSLKNIASFFLFMFLLRNNTCIQFISCEALAF